jgi:hypothetical protein
VSDANTELLVRMAEALGDLPWGMHERRRLAGLNVEEPKFGVRA